MTARDMCAEAVTRRLREVSRLADLDGHRRLSAKVDLSPSAVGNRLREVSLLRALCLRLGRVRPVEPRPPRG